jgi:hypothetical protein
MPLLTAIILAPVVPTALLAVTLFLVSLQPKRGLLIDLAVAVFVPLLALLIFIANGYRHWNWFPFSYGSLFPHFIAAVVSLSLLLRALIRVSGSTRAKVLVGVLATASWFGLWLGGMFVTGCSMGDCI